MDAIYEALKSSIEDFNMARSERRDLKELLKPIKSDRTKKALTRAKAFELASENLKIHKNHEVFEWLEDVVKLIYSKESSLKSSAYFSPGDDCLNRICRLIDESTRSIDICVFTITDNRITKRIVEAFSRKIKIRIISDNTKSEDRGSDVDYLRSKGIECLFDSTSAHMHHKFAISDNKLLLNGSYNWTRSASTENNENISITNDLRLVSLFQNEFERLWEDLS